MIRSRLRFLVLVVAGVAGLAGVTGAQRPAAAPNKQLLLVLDGLRPDYVTADVMPNLYALGQRGNGIAQYLADVRRAGHRLGLARVDALAVKTGVEPFADGGETDSVEPDSLSCALTAKLTGEATCIGESFGRAHLDG